MARISCKDGSVAKATSPQAMRGEVLKCLKSLEYDPKPSDLTQGKVKRR